MAPHVRPNLPQVRRRHTAYTHYLAGDPNTIPDMPRMELSLAGRQVTLKTDLSYQGLAGGALRAPLCLLPGEELRNKSAETCLAVLVRMSHQACLTTANQRASPF